MTTAHSNEKPAQIKPALTRKSSIVYKITMTLYFGLALAMLAEIWWLNPPQGSRIAITALAIIPLLLPIVGLLKRSPRSAAWLCFILCFYFISGVLSVSARPESAHGWLIAIISCTLFVTAMIFIRWQSQAKRVI